MKRQFCIGTAATMLCLSQLSNMGIAKAIPTCTDVSQGCLKINLEALQVTFQEIVPDGQSVQLVPYGSPLDSSPPPNINTQISRTIDDLWQLEVPQNSENNLVVNYQYEDPSNSSGSGSKVRLQNIDKLPIRVIGQSSTNPGKVIVQGGATFNFSLSDIKSSGNYRGNLQITVTGF